MSFYTPKPTEMKRHNWCGPYALAVLFGCSYDRAYGLAKAYLGQKRITGMWNSEVLHCIELRNRDVKRQLRVSKLPDSSLYVQRPVRCEGANYSITERKNKTLTQWYKTRPNKRGTYLVQITGHYVIVKGTKIIDNHSKEWQPFHKRRSYKRSLVRNIFEIERNQRHG